MSSRSGFIAPNLSAIRGLEDPHDLELTLDEEPILRASVGGDKDLVAPQTNPTEASDTLEATRLRVRRAVKAGQRAVAAAFLDATPPLFETNRLQRFIRDFSNPFDAEGAPHVQSITIQGPFGARTVGAPPSPRVFICRPGVRRGGSSDPPSEDTCARRILSSLATQAYRRPISDAELNDLVSYYSRAKGSGSFQPGPPTRGLGALGWKDGIQFGLRRILASPSFVFRPEAEPSLAFELSPRAKALVGEVGPGDNTPMRLKLAGGVSLFSWFAVLYFGRMLPFIGNAF